MAEPQGTGIAYIESAESSSSDSGTEELDLEDSNPSCSGQVSYGFEVIGKN
jgi:hypothetical protein